MNADGLHSDVFGLVTGIIQLRDILLPWGNRVRINNLIIPRRHRLAVPLLN